MSGEHVCGIEMTAMSGGSYWSKRVAETMEGCTEHEDGNENIDKRGGDFYASSTDLEQIVNDRRYVHINSRQDEIEPCGSYQRLWNYSLRYF